MAFRNAQPLVAWDIAEAGDTRNRPARRRQDLVVRRAGYLVEDDAHDAHGGIEVRESADKRGHARAHARRVNDQDDGNAEEVRRRSGAPGARAAGTVEESHHAFHDTDISAG